MSNQIVYNVLTGPVSTKPVKDFIWIDKWSTQVRNVDKNGVLISSGEHVNYNTKTFLLSHVATPEMVLSEEGCPSIRTVIPRYTYSFLESNFKKVEYIIATSWYSNLRRGIAVTIRINSKVIKVIPNLENFITSWYHIKFVSWIFPIIIQTNYE